MYILKIFACGCKIESASTSTFVDECMSFCHRHNAFNITTATLLELPMPDCPKCNLNSAVVIHTESYHCRHCNTNFIPHPVVKESIHD
jgi:hypothetical protein